jgi:hypothetical protein
MRDGWRDVVGARPSAGCGRGDEQAIRERAVAILAACPLLHADGQALGIDVGP